MDTIKLYFTTFGDVYPGMDYPNERFPNKRIIVPPNKITEYRKLNHQDITLDEIKKYAKVFPSSAYVREVWQEEIPDNNALIEREDWGNEYNRKDMFIIGAGASAKCVDKSRKKEFGNDNLSPPLGNGLFKSKLQYIYDKYQGITDVIHDLQDENINVEEYLEKEWEKVVENGSQTVMSRHINIQFYLQELLMKISDRVSTEYYNVNLYAELAKKLKEINDKDSKRHFAFVSFNQDTILEDCLSKSFGLPPLTDMDSYLETDKKPFCVYKPHGSCNWGWKFPNKVANPQKELFDNRTNFYKLYFEILGNRTEMVDKSSYGDEVVRDKHGVGKVTVNKSKIVCFEQESALDYYPAILLPYRDKDEFTLPPDHYEDLTFYISGVENLYIIGWKGNEALFNKVFKECKAEGKEAVKLKRVIIVDPEAKMVKENIKELLDDGVCVTPYDGGFQDFINRGLKELD